MHGRTSLPTALAVSVLAVAVCLPASAISVHAPGLPELVARAQRIVVTEVVDVRTEVRTTRDGSLPFTLATLRAVRTLKGEPAVEILIELPGGEVEGQRVEVLGLPRFRAGDRDVLFLAAHGGLSPTVALSHGRFRVRSGAGGSDVVVREDAGGIFEVPLATFEREIRRLLAGSGSFDSRRVMPLAQDRLDAGSAKGQQTEFQLAASRVRERWPAPVVTTLNLGPSPALLNDCADWPCVVARALEPFGVSSEGEQRVAGVKTREGGVTSGVPEEGRAAREGAGLEIAWATEVFGRPLDDLTAAVTVRKEVEGRRTVTVLLNRGLAWNAYEGDARLDALGRPLLDLQRVLAAELATVFEAPATPPEPVAGLAPEATAGRRRCASRTRARGRSAFPRRKRRGLRPVRSARATPARACSPTRACSCSSRPTTGR